MEKLNDKQFAKKISTLSAENLQMILANPFYAINIAPMLASPHETMISEDTFIKAGVSEIKEIGAEKYLHNLLENLKGNYVAGFDGVVAGFDGVDDIK
jgi:hypothetical protein